MQSEVDPYPPKLNSSASRTSLIFDQDLEKVPIQNQSVGSFEISEELAMISNS